MSRRSIRTRREWLATCGGTTAGIAALAGCTGSNDDSENGDAESNGDENGEEPEDNGENRPLSGSEGGSWPMSEFAANNRMVTDDWSGPSGPVEEGWTIQLEENLSEPVVGHGFVYVVEEGTTLYAIDVVSGETEWETDGADTGLTTPAVTDDAVYFLTDTLRAIDPESGDERWTLELGSSGSGDIRLSDDRVYVNNGDTLYVVDAESPAISWERTVDNVRNIAVGPDGTFYVTRQVNSGSDYEVMAFDVDSDETLWTYSPAENIDGGRSLLVEDGTIYVHEDHTIAAIDTETGDGETVIEFEKREDEHLHGDEFLLSGGAPAIVNGTAYSSGAYNQRAVYAADLESGDEPSEWNSDAIGSGPAALRPFVADDTLYIWRDFGYVDLEALDLDTGEKQWTYHVTSHIDIWGSLVEGYAILDDTIVFTVNGDRSSAVGTLESE